MLTMSTPSKLPKLRKGVTFAFGDYDSEGKPQWMIHDAGRNKFFIIGWVEYEILQRWALGDINDIINAVNHETTLYIESVDVENVLRFLAYNYLIEQSGYEIYKKAKEQQLFKKDSLIHWLISYYLFFRIPLWYPDKFLSRTKRIGQLLFSQTTGYVMMALALIALFQISLSWEKFTHTFSTIFTFKGLFFYFIAYIICKFFHELGHGYMCKLYGVKVPTLGVAFLVFWPVLYTDTTLSWSLTSAQRLRIALAGIWVETYITIFAALIWCNVDNLIVQSICYVTITINWMASLLINVSPFMRFDGYYVLADYLKMPNLQPRAFALTRWQIRRWLFDWADPPPEKFPRGRHNFLVVYSIFTWLYRLVLYLAIAILVYHFFIKALGIILFVVEMIYFILRPICSEFKFWYLSREKFSLNTRTLITMFFTGLFVLLFFLPVKDSLEIPGTIGYAHQFLIAPDEGILISDIPKNGTIVKANQPLVTISPTELDYQIQQSNLEYKKLVKVLRSSSIDNQLIEQKSVVLSQINKQKADHQKLVQQHAKFTLSVPFNGIVSDSESDMKPGTVIMKNAWLADVIDPNIVLGEAFVPQEDYNSLKVGMTGYFYPDDLTQERVPVKINTIEVLNLSKLNCHYAGEISQNMNEDMVVESACYNSNIFGGQVPVFGADESSFVPVNSTFRVVLTVTKPITLTKVERGMMKLDIHAKSYASSFFYQLKTILIGQSGF